MSPSSDKKTNFRAAVSGFRKALAHLRPVASKLATPLRALPRSGRPLNMLWRRGVPRLPLRGRAPAI